MEKEKGEQAMFTNIPRDAWREALQTFTGP
jgi:hypothetical protein